MEKVWAPPAPQKCPLNKTCRKLMGVSLKCMQQHNGAELGTLPIAHQFRHHPSVFKMHSA